MSNISPELQQCVTGLTNEISRGHFDKAITLGEKALAMEELHNSDNTSLLGEVYRNMAAASDRSSKFDAALGYIERAHDIHKAAVDEGNPEVGPIHERAATASYVGIFALKSYLLGADRDETLADKALAMSRQAEADIVKVNQLSKRRHPDQYEINMASRWSMIESLAGDKRRGLALAGRAIRLARWSEYDQQKGLTRKDVLRARTRAAVRGIAAVAVNVMSRFGVTQGVAGKIALKTL